MIKTEVVKGIDKPPMLFGIRASLVMYMISIIVTVSILLLLMIVYTFFKGLVGLAFLGILVWFISFFVIFFLFRQYSVIKPYKTLKSKPDIITNKNLNEFL